jgi:hypothetical protein
VNVQAGLSSDEIAAARWLYGQPSTLASLGSVRGNVTMNGSAVLGAAVLAEATVSGNLVAGTVTRADGSYDLPAMPPGQYGVRVTPLDPPVANNIPFLIRGRDIAPAYDSAGTSFLPSSTSAVMLTAGSTVTTNFAVASLRSG